MLSQKRCKCDKQLGFDDRSINVYRRFKLWYIRGLTPKLVTS